jgi:hypothetical protein
MAITAGYIFKDGEKILAKKLNLAFSGSGSVVIPYGSTLTFLDSSGAAGPVMSDESGAILCTKEIRMRGTNALFGVNNTNATDRAFATDTPTDTFNRFNFDGNGTMGWGTGSAAPDVNLARSAVGTLIVAGASYGVRFQTNVAGAFVEGVDSAASSFQPLYVGGSLINLQAGGTTIGTVTSAGLTVSSGKDLQVGRAYAAGVVVSTGTITIKDSTGTSYRVACAV